MHWKKAELLAGLEEACRLNDESLRHALGVVRHPERGWAGSLGTAALGLPLIGVAAALTDLSYVLVARTPDDRWARAFPGGGGVADGDDRDRTT